MWIRGLFIYLSFGEDCICYISCYWLVRLFNRACFFCGSEALPISLPDGEERDRSSENILLFDIIALSPIAFRLISPAKMKKQFKSQSSAPDQ